MKAIRLDDATAKAEGGEVIITGQVENSNEMVEIHLSLEVLESLKPKATKKEAK